MDIKNYLQTVNKMPQTIVDTVFPYFQEDEIEAKHHIIEEGKVSRKTFYLESGYIRSYVIDRNGDEVTTRIYAGPVFVNDYLSFFKKQPCKINYQTITPCKLLSMTFKDMQYCFHNIPAFREWGRMQLTLNYEYAQERTLSLLQDSAESRYSSLLKRAPDILQHVPLGIVASYLGITKSSLSRVRKKISQG